METETSVIDIEEIKKPKPSDRNSYCTICKSRFEEYEEHLKSVDHDRKMKGSIYNKYIR